MTAKLNRRALQHAEQLIKQRHVVADEMDSWSEHQPSTRDENRYLKEHGFGEYGLWYLGIDPEQGLETKSRYKFPYGDFRDAHRCGILAAEVRAARLKYSEIEKAAAHLHGMVDAVTVKA